MSLRLCAALGASALLFTGLVLAAPEPVELATARASMRTMSVPFVPNAGQWESAAAYAARTFAGTLFVTTDGRLVYSLTGKPVVVDPRKDSVPPALRNRARARSQGWVLTETAVDAQHLPLRAAPFGTGLQAGKVSYAIGGDQSNYRDSLASYERIDLGELYPGIGVQVRATGSNVEKIFTVAPLRDPREIRIRLDGAQRLEVGSGGELIAHTGDGPVIYTAPVAYQTDDSGNRTAVPVHYALDTTAGSYGFRVGAYDSARPLVIDPLLQSTYLGGNGDDVATAIAIHPTSGDVYVTGYTMSTNFPKVAGSQQTAKANNWDVFVTRLNAALTSRLQSTYLGGGGDDEPAALAIHPTTGDVYVTGYTYSTDFPATSGGAQSVHASDGSLADVFITRLNAALTTRVQSTYFGGNSLDAATTLAIHPTSGEIYVAGYTVSTNLPGVANSEQTANANFLPGYDAFVARFNAGLTANTQSTYLGGARNDFAWAMAINAAGDVYVAGTTLSDDFPKVSGAEQASRSSGYDMFVTRLNTALTTRVQSSYLGGSGDDVVSAIAVHPVTGDVYLTGNTYSLDFPKVSGAVQPNLTDGNDAFVSRFNAALTGILQSTYLGGSGSDEATAIAIHPVTGDVYVAGSTTSLDFPKVVGAPQAAHANDSVFQNGVPIVQLDGFVARLNAPLTALFQSTYLGGNGADSVNAVAIHPTTGNVYAAGDTTSTNFPGVTGSEQIAKGTGIDAFVSSQTSDLLAVSITCNLDVDGNSIVDPLTDGLLIMRAMFGLTGTAVTDGAVGVGATRGTWALLQPYLSNLALDVDGNGKLDPLTDGLLLMRAMSGLTGTAVTNGAIGSGAGRGTWASIQLYLNSTCGTTFAP